MLQDVETTRKNLARVRIYFEELNYQKVEQVPTWTIDSILGAVGGLMGLYVGISSITLAEIIVFLFSLLKQCCKSVLCMNKVHPSK
jgi:non-ribosomal peptide synthetase component F